MTVTPVNDPPVGNSDAYVPSEDVALVVPAATGVLADDTDVDSATLTAVLVSLPTHGTLTLQASGAFTYTPATNYNGPDSFTYRADDGPLQSANTQVTLTVAAVNDPPTFTLGSAPTVAEDSGAATVASFLTAVSPGPADEAGQDTSWTVVASSPVLFATQPAINASGTLTFRPATNLSGSSIVTVTVTDDAGVAGGGDDATAKTFVITVAGTNDPIFANTDTWMLDDDPPAWIEAGVTTVLDVRANDFSPDIGEVLSIVSATKPLHGTVTIAPGGQGLSYRSTVGYAGNDSFVYTLSDGVFSDTASVLVSVADTLAPALSGPTLRFDTGARLGGSTVAVVLGWSAADPGSGVKSYDVQQTIDGGANWTPLFNAATVTSSPRTLAIDASRQFRFRARDKGNRLSGWSAPVTALPSRYQETTSLASYGGGTWKRPTIASASGDHTRYAKVKGATSTFTFTGRAVSLVSPRGSSRGKAQIRVDGTLVATVNLYRSSLDARRHVWSRSWTSVGTHVVSVRVLGTSGHPRFDIDAWTVLK
jgi:VCBS repeat-containing protein